MEILQEVAIRCGHCGDMTSCNVKASYRYFVKSEDNFKYDATHTWFLLQCSLCLRPVLVEYIDCGSEVENDTILLFPVERSLKEYASSIPMSVRKAYLAALKVQKIESNAFAVLVGRTLEVVCKHEKAKGKVLAEKIMDLANSGRIPKILADMAIQLRQLRNLGAHADEDEVNSEDVQSIREFVDAILEYLYVAPAKIAHLQARLDGKPENSPFYPNPNDFPF